MNIFATVRERVKLGGLHGTQLHPNWWENNTKFFAVCHYSATGKQPTRSVKALVAYATVLQITMTTLSYIFKFIQFSSVISCCLSFYLSAVDLGATVFKKEFKP